MATSIVSPGMGSIDNAFGSIYNMFGGKGSQAGGVPLGGSVFGQPMAGGFSGGFGMPFNTSPQPDQVMSSVWNMLGQAGPSFLQQGTNVIGTGMGVTGGGLDMTGTGFGTTQAGLATLQPSVDFYTRLMSGDPTAVTQATAPAANALSAIYSPLMTQTAEGSPLGGFRSAVLPELAGAQAKQVGDYTTQQIAAAPAALASLGSEIAGIGGTEAGIGSDVSGTGLSIGGLGTTLTGQGFGALNSLQQGAINKQGLNYSQPSALQQAMQAFQTFIG